MSKAEKNDILDKHKTLYDGYVTEYGKPNNQQPLYVQDFANDKDGITVSNKGEVKRYTNVNINEDLDRRDRIGDGPHDLKNGTVDMEGGDKYPSPNEDEVEFISIGFFDADDDWSDDNESRYDDRVNYGIDDESRYTDNDDDDDDDYYEEDYYEEDEEEDDEDYMNSDFSDFMGTGDSFRDRVDDDELPDFMEKLNESLDMFRRFKRYN